MSRHIDTAGGTMIPIQEFNRNLKHLASSFTVNAPF